MNTPYICHRCSRHFVTLLVKEARYSTTGNASRKVRKQVKRTEKSRSADAEGAWRHGRQDDWIQQAKVTRSDSLLGTLFTSKQDPSPPRHRRYSREPIQGVEKERPPQEVKLFQSIVKIQGHVEDAKPANSKKQDKEEAHTAAETTGLATLSHELEQLRVRHLSKTETLPDIWRSIASILDKWSASRSSELLRQPKLLTFLGDVLKCIAREGRISVDGVIVDPIKVISLYATCRVLQDWWHEVAWIQLSNLIQGENGSSAQSSKQSLDNVLRVLTEYYARSAQVRNGPHSAPDVPTQDIDVFQPNTLSHGHPATEENDDPSRPCLLALEGSDSGLSVGSPDKDKMGLPRRLSERFTHLFGSGEHQRRTRIMASAAILVVHYVESVKLEQPQNGFEGYEELVQRLRVLADGVQFDCESFAWCLRAVHTPEEAIDKAELEWMRSPVKAIMKAPVYESLSKDVENKTTAVLTKKKLPELFHEINRVRETENGEQAVHLWQTVKKQILSKDGLNESHRSILIARFLKLFNELYLMSHTTDVWNHMISLGQKPEKQHWLAMISGCSNARDQQSMQGLWQNMLISGMEPDNDLWTAYIHGVIRAGHHQHGLILLEHLARSWRSKSNPIQPALGPIHGALSGFIDMKSNWGRNAVMRMQQTIVNWAREQNLKPTTFTYNILLTPNATVATAAEISTHLEAMSADACEPDLVTWTLILRGLMAPKSPFFSLPEPEQTSSIQEILSSMDAQSLKLDPRTYTTLLFGLLDSRTHPPNASAAYLVLEHMDAAGLEPSSHTHTILLTHYFKSDPPNLPAVEALLQKLLKNTSTRDRLGSFFWNRVIASYADVGEWEKSLHYLRNRPLDKQAVSWTALWRLLLSLGRAREWGICAEVVQEVETGNRMKLGGTGVGGPGHTEYVNEVRRLRERGMINSEVERRTKLYETRGERKTGG